MSDDFRFCFKLPRTITHDQQLRGPGEELTDFVRMMKPLHDVMGPTSVQLPASFGPEDLSVLDSFLTKLPTDMQWAVEVRNPSFFVSGDHERPLDDLLRRHGVNRVIFDTRALFEWCEEGAEPYFFFHTPDNFAAPQQALAVNNAVAELTERVASTEVPNFDHTLFGPE